MSDGIKPIEWAILIATISQPFVSYWLETRRDKKFDELKQDLKKKLEENEIKNQEKYGKEFAEIIIKFYEETERIGKRLIEESCSNCGNKLERVLKENLEIKKK